MATDDNPQSVAKVACEDKVREDKPRVEVIDGLLCSAAELRRALGFTHNRRAAVPGAAA